MRVRWCQLSKATRLGFIVNPLIRTELRDRRSQGGLCSLDSCCLFPNPLSNRSWHCCSAPARLEHSPAAASSSDWSLFDSRQTALRFFQGVFFHCARLGVSWEEQSRASTCLLAGVVLGCVSTPSNGTRPSCLTGCRRFRCSRLCEAKRVAILVLRFFLCAFRLWDSISCSNTPLTFVCAVLCCCFPSPLLVAVAIPPKYE